MPHHPSRRDALRRIASASAALASFSIARGAQAAALQPMTWAEGLDHPWGLAFLPDGRALVTEKAGRLALIDAGGGEAKTRVSGVPEVHARGQGGLLDVAVRTEGNDLMVYLSYAEAGRGADAGRNGTAVALDGTKATGREAIYASLGERIRDVRHGPDGALNLLTDSSRARVLRVAR